MGIISRASIHGVNGPLALSWRVWLVGMGGSELLLAAFGASGSLAQAAAVSGSVWLVSAPLILLPGWFVLPRVRHPRWRGLVVGGAYIAAAAAASVTSLWVRSLFAPMDEPAANAINGMIYYSWFLSIVSILFNDRFEFATDMKRLRVIRGQLRAVADWRMFTFVDARGAIVARIEAQIDRLREAVKSSATASTASHPEPRHDPLRSILNEIDDLAVPADLRADTEVPRIERRRAMRDVIDVAFGAGRQITVPTSLFIATTWLVTGISMGSLFVTLIVTVVSAAMTYACVCLAQRSIVTMAQRLPRGARVPVVIVTWIVSAGISGIVPVVMAGIPLTTLAPIAIQTALVMVVFAFAIGFRGAGVMLRERIALENSELERRAVESATDARVVRDQLRSIVHGDLQGALLAVERRLNAMSELTDEEARAFHAEVDAVMGSLRERLAHPARIDVFDSIDELRTIWGDTLQIDVRWSADARAIVESNAITSRVLSEVLKELATNAAKHDRATSIAVSIACDTRDANTLTLDARTVGLGSDDPARTPSSAGFGTQLLNDVCLSWKRSRVASGMHITATIPVVTS